MNEATNSRDKWLEIRADLLARSRATDLAWAAFRFDRGLAPTHWSICGGGFIRGARREGDTRRVTIMRQQYRQSSDVAAVVIVNDRTGVCKVTFNPEFVWDAEVTFDREPPSTLCPNCGADLTGRPQEQFILGSGHPSTE